MSAFCHIQLQWKVIERFWNNIRKMWSVCTKIAPIENKISKEKFRTPVCCLCVNLPAVKIGGQSDEFPMSFSSLQCPLQVNKLIRENSAKYVNQTGNFYFRPKLKTAISLPIFSLFQWFLFCITDFFWIITLTKKSKFDTDLKVYSLRHRRSLSKSLAEWTMKFRFLSSETNLR